MHPSIQTTAALFGIPESALAQSMFLGYQRERADKGIEDYHTGFGSRPIVPSKIIRSAVLSKKLSAITQILGGVRGGQPKTVFQGVVTTDSGRVMVTGLKVVGGYLIEHLVYAPDITDAEIESEQRLHIESLQEAMWEAAVS